jgi:2-hydroxychromene-2-carboxylate isomerase
MDVPITLPPVSPQPHTHLAFEGYQYAKEQGKGNEYNHRVLEAFFVERKDIGQIDVLTRLAGEVGLNEKEFEEALGTRKYREAHRLTLPISCHLGHSVRLGPAATRCVTRGGQSPACSARAAATSAQSSSVTRSC